MFSRLMHYVFYAIFLQVSEIVYKQVKYIASNHNYAFTLIYNNNIIILTDLKMPTSYFPLPTSVWFYIPVLPKGLLNLA